MKNIFWIFLVALISACGTDPSAPKDTPDTGTDPNNEVDAGPDAEPDANNGDCTDGDTDSTSCGLNDRGSQDLVCVNGEFVNDGDCADPDECTDGETGEESCGINGTQALICVEGQWAADGQCEEAGECEENDTRDLACGLNAQGTQAQVCTGGTWTNDGDCVDPDVCTNAETQDVSCGLNGNGTQAQTCENGQWANTGDCVGDDACTNGETQDVACGLNGNGTQAQTCENGQWADTGDCTDADVCTNGATQDVACGLNGNGTQAQTCENGQWADTGDCTDTDVCTNGATQDVACGLNGNGTQAQTCESGQWADTGACADPDICVEGATQTVACGLNNRGSSDETCTGGQWVGQCVDPDVCVDGSQQAITCDGNAEQETCVDGAWELPANFHIQDGVCVSNVTITECWIQFPKSVSQADSLVTVYGRLNANPAVAEADGLRGVMARACYGNAISPFTSDDIDVCVDAEWNPSPLGGGFEYQADLDFPNGDSAYVYSFSGDGGATWVYCGVTDGAPAIAESADIDAAPASIVPFATITPDPVVLEPDTIVTVRIEFPAPATAEGLLSVSITGGLLVDSDTPIFAIGDTFVEVDVLSGATEADAVLTVTNEANQSITADVRVRNPCLIISEYIEGSSNNKGVEFFNCGEIPVNLDEFQLCLAANDATGCSSNIDMPSLTLLPGDVATSCNSSVNVTLFPDGTCDLKIGSISFNGDDRLMVYRDLDASGSFTTDDVIFDAYGQTAVEPSGTPWAEVTHRRCDFTPFDGTSAWTPEEYFSAHPRDDVSDFGIAPDTTATCPAP
jgi:hypothetical protein